MRQQRDGAGAPGRAGQSWPLLGPGRDLEPAAAHTPALDTGQPPVRADKSTVSSSD